MLNPILHLQRDVIQNKSKNSKNTHFLIMRRMKIYVSLLLLIIFTEILKRTAFIIGIGISFCIEHK